MALIDEELKAALRQHKEREPNAEDIRKAVDLVFKRLKSPLVDTWGCTHAAHLVTMIERLGLVSTEVQNVAEAHRNEMPGSERSYREDLVGQLAELGANVLVMIVDEMRSIRKLG